MSEWLREKALEALEKEGRTKRWVADFCGLNLQSLNHYLAGRRQPSRPVVKLIAQALNTTEEFLTNESNLPKEASQ